MFERALWITADPNNKDPNKKWNVRTKIEEMPPAPYITRGFDTAAKAVSATLSIAALGQGAYYINGVRVPDSYLPTQPKNPMKTVPYRVYDVTDMLQPGRNRIGVILGNIGYNDLAVHDWRSNTKMLCQLDLRYDDGTEQSIVSDSSWRYHASPTLFSMFKCGEKYDARLAIPDWCMPDFDDSGFERVSLSRSPGGKLERSVCPPVRVKKELRGREISPGVFDFGEHGSGWVRIAVRGRAGSEIVIRYAENLTEDGRHVDQSNMVLPWDNKDMGHTDRYILCGKGEELWEQLFSYHGFRYAEITGAYDTLEATARIAYTDMPLVSAFECDNEIVNGIHQACLNSIRSNCHGALTDCPTREQSYWTGDAMFSAQAVNLAFDAEGMFTDWLRTFQDEQFPDGSLPCHIPTYDSLFGANFASGADWDSVIFHAPYYLFKYSGNRGIVDMMWDNMNRSLAFLGHSSESCLISNGIGDWAALEMLRLIRDPAFDIIGMCPKEITDTAYYRMDTLMMAHMAGLTGREEQPYRTLAENIRRDFRARYVREGRLTVRHITALSMAIFTGMLDEDEAKAEAAALNQMIVDDGYQFTCGLHGMRTIFDVLTRYGYAETLFKTVTNTQHYGYGYSVSHGFRTLPEHFAFDVKLAGARTRVCSRNHHYMSFVDTWFFEYLAGIQVLGFGQEGVRIAPCFVEGIGSLRAELRGIRVAYDAKEIRVDSPQPFTFVYDGKEKAYPAGSYGFPRG